MARIERTLNRLPPKVDPGPAAAPFTGAIVIRFLSADQVRARCPANLSHNSLACTDMQRRVVTMPNEASSGLSTARWLALLRHEILHAQGMAFHAH